MAKQLRTKKVEVLLTDDEYSEIVRQADKMKWSQSELMRAATFTYLVTQGNRVAWRLLIGNVGESLAGFLVYRRLSDEEVKKLIPETGVRV